MKIELNQVCKAVLYFIIASIDISIFIKLVDYILNIAKTSIT